MKIDFRSDTVTKPTPAMAKCMLAAEVGDDVYGEDPSINELESFVAKLFGKDQSLFCPSGTMTNQIAIKCHTQPADEVICDTNAHVYQYEVGGIAFHSGCSVKTIDGHYGLISPEQVKEAVNPIDLHKAKTSLVCVENTSNRGGGTCYSLDTLHKIKKICDTNGLKFHLDGARLFNAIVAKQESTTLYGKLFDSISICLSKGLGAPVGSLLIGDHVFINKARRYRKLFGGAMRQAGYLANAGLYALQHHIDRLKEDHIHAYYIKEALIKKTAIIDMNPVETNIIIFTFAQPQVALEWKNKMLQNDILVSLINPCKVRMVTHLDITNAMVEKTVQFIHSL